MTIPLLDIGLKIIEKLIPDPQAKASAQLEMLKLQQAGEFKEIEIALQDRLAQVEVNKIEAASGDLFRGGWRPGVGWICVLGLGYSLIGQPLLEWLSLLQGWPVPPVLETGTLLTLLFGMLGLSTNRMVEKVKGVA